MATALDCCARSYDLWNGVAAILIYKQIGDLRANRYCDLRDATSADKWRELVKREGRDSTVNKQPYVIEGPMCVNKRALTWKNWGGWTPTMSDSPAMQICIKKDEVVRKCLKLRAAIIIRLDQ